MPPVRMAVSMVFCRRLGGARPPPSPRPAAAAPPRARRPSGPPRSPAAWRAISRCCWAGVIVFMPGRRRRVDAGPHRRLGRGLPRPRRAGAVIRSWALSRSTVGPYLAWSGLAAIVPRNWTSSIGAMQRVGRQQPGRGERRRHAPRRQHRHERLAGAERGDRLLDVVELGHREGPRGLAQRVGVVGRERPQRVLDAVAELGEDRRRDVGRRLGHEVDADALRADQPGGPLDLVHQRLGRVVEQQVRLVEEEAQLRLGQVARLGQALVQLGQHPEHERGEQARLVHDVRQLEDADDALRPRASSAAGPRRRTRARRRRRRRPPARARRSSAGARRPRPPTSRRSRPGSACPRRTRGT